MSVDHACRKILEHGTSSFTCHPKEGVVQIFIVLKNPSPWPGLNPRPLGPVASTLTTTPPRRPGVSIGLLKVEILVLHEGLCEAFYIKCKQDLVVKGLWSVPEVMDLLLSGTRVAHINSLEPSLCCKSSLLTSIIILIFGLLEPLHGCLYCPCM
jgi:hypothetical protein